MGQEKLILVGMAWYISSDKTKEIVRDFPSVEVQKEIKKVKISGHSRMTDPGEFYLKLSERLEKLFYSFDKILNVDIQFEYINTGSSKWLYYLISRLRDLCITEGSIEINWYFESDDETILETGEVLQSLVTIPFNLISFD